ncbi:hypothetical protein [Rubellicoccus peritrichatus]|uniref:Uncharacterized protein n=1 Tax=Rubellicoccus peritrichatus TaxID=3080537 RepID=A0AAQ3QWU2_9BACT|nr:hypothetical protein [Puniceicoccus sp. CR14]WOO42257.1 hypothetical protein RZN69_04090 [Puniceicoccus sp. CR14]
MKKVFASIGLLLLLFPILTIEVKMNGIANSESSKEVVSSLYGIMGGLFQGFFGLMILGFVCDGGKGYKKKWLLISMLLLGAIWIIRYPSGWMLGIPLMVYAGEKLFKEIRNKKSNKSVVTTPEAAPHAS